VSVSFPCDEENAVGDGGERMRRQKVEDLKQKLSLFKVRKKEVDCPPKRGLHLRALTNIQMDEFFYAEGGIDP